MMKAVAAVIAALFLLTATEELAARSGGSHDSEALDWLGRMATAMDQMSYQGTFVYIQDDRLETIRITHVATPEGSRERLVSLSGDRRESRFRRCFARPSPDRRATGWLRFEQ